MAAFEGRVMKFSDGKGTDYETITFEEAEKFKTLSRLIGDQFTNEDETGDADIPMPDYVTKASVDRVLAFLRHYIVEPMEKFEKPLKKKVIEEDAKPAWYAEFIKVENKPMSWYADASEEEKQADFQSKELLCELYMTSDYLDIPELTELCGAMIATLVDQKKAREIDVLLHKPFGDDLFKDFDPENKELQEQILNENKWCELLDCGLGGDEKVPGTEEA